MQHCCFCFDEYDIYLMMVFKYFERAKQLGKGTV